MSLLDTDAEEPSPAAPNPLRRGLLIVVVLVAVGYGLVALLRPVPEVTEPVPSPSVSTPVPGTSPEIEPTVEIEAAPEPAPEPTPAAPSRPAPPPPAAPAVVLRVASDVDGADVFIDRRHVGQTPFESFDVAPGAHRINVSAAGYDGFVEDVEIGDELTDISVAFTEVRLSQSVAVVHKHRFGSCEGRLVAGLNGILYETDHNDSFSVQLDELEEFTIDYLEHALRIKPRDGRRYDFTDDQPNADALFVFHREVEGARERLASGDQPAGS